MSQNFVYKNKVGTVNDPRGYAINWIKQFSPDQPVNIFDVGCACGDLGIAIRENNIVGEIWGLEYDIESVNYAKKLNVYNDILHVDLNNFKSENFKNLENRFDYIYFGDVLEHILFPQDIIKIFQNFLKPNGKIIVSLPNISHGSIKANIMLNNFDYTETGILDKTHIRFFTYKTFAKFLSDGDLKIEIFKPTLFGLLGTQPNNPYNDLGFFIKYQISKDQHSYVIQYVALCGIEKQINNKSNLFENNRLIIENIMSSLNNYKFIKTNKDIFKNNFQKIIFKIYLKIKFLCKK